MFLVLCISLMLIFVLPYVLSNKLILGKSEGSVVLVTRRNLSHGRAMLILISYLQLR